MLELICYTNINESCLKQKYFDQQVSPEWVDFEIDSDSMSITYSDSENDDDKNMPIAIFSNIRINFKKVAVPILLTRPIVAGP